MLFRSRETIKRETSNKQSESDNKREDTEMIHKRLGGFMVGHGRGIENAPEDSSTTSTKKSTENLTAKSEEIENRLFIELERKLYGNWINKKNKIQLNIKDHC